MLSSDANNYQYERHDRRVTKCSYIKSYILSRYIGFIVIFATRTIIFLST